MAAVKRFSPADTEKVYRFIAGYIAAHHGLAPSQLEIARACHMSRSSVQKHLMFLVGEGRIGWIEGGKRAIWLIGGDTLTPDG